MERWINALFAVLMTVWLLTTVAVAVWYFQSAPTPVSVP